MYVSNEWSLNDQIDNMVITKHTETSLLNSACIAAAFGMTPISTYPEASGIDAYIDRLIEIDWMFTYFRQLFTHNKAWVSCQWKEPSKLDGKTQIMYVKNFDKYLILAPDLRKVYV